MTPLSQRILALRERLGWTQQRLAAAVGRSQASISQYESGAQLPSGAVAARLQEIEDASR